MTRWINQFSWVKRDNVKSYWLWHDVSVSSIRLNRIMSNHIYYWIICRSGQIGSYQIILILTWCVSQANYFKLFHVKSYWLWHDVSFRSVRSNWFMSNHIDYDMMCHLGRLCQMVSCQIILLMALLTTCKIQFSLVYIQQLATFNLVKHILKNLKHLEFTSMFIASSITLASCAIVSVPLLAFRLEVT